MIEINLLPEELRKKQKSKGPGLDISKLNLQNAPIMRWLGIGFAAVLALQVVLFLVGIACNMHYSSLEKRYKEILPQKKEADALKAQVDTINKKMKAIDDLMVNRFSWSKKLGQLNDCMTPGIWLSELSYDEKVVEKPVAQLTGQQPKKAKSSEGSAPKVITKKVSSRYLILSGYASSMGEEGTALIGKFIKSLKDNKDFYSDFSEIELGKIKSDKIEDQEVMSFQITCFFK